MPIYLRTAGYKIYFWSNERGEAIHFHVTNSKVLSYDFIYSY